MSKIKDKTIKDKFKKWVEKNKVDFLGVTGGRSTNADKEITELNSCFNYHLVFGIQEHDDEVSTNIKNPFDFFAAQHKRWEDVPRKSKEKKNKYNFNNDIYEATKKMNGLVVFGFNSKKLSKRTLLAIDIARERKIPMFFWPVSKKKIKPYGIDTNSENVFFADGENGRVIQLKKKDFKTFKPIVTGLDNPIGLYVFKEKIFITDKDKIIKYCIKTGEKNIIVEGLNEPHGIFVDENRILLAEYGNNRILQIDLKTMAKSVIMELYYPTDLTVCGGEIYVCDKTKDRVIKYNPKSENNYDVVVEYINSPESICSYNDEVYILFCAYDRIIKYNPIEDKIIDIFIPYLRIGGSIKVDEDGIYITQNLHNRVIKFDRNSICSYFGEKHVEYTDKKDSSKLNKHKFDQIIQRLENLLNDDLLNRAQTCSFLDRFNHDILLNKFGK